MEYPARACPRLSLSSLTPSKEGATDDEKKAWKLKAKGVYRANVKATSRRKQAWDTLNVAQKMVEHERIYFPHRLDFRGRAYPIPLFLNPQGTDYVKALLTFADGVAINDERAAGWLAIHGANTYGKDKLAMADRIQWVWDNEPMIRLVATDPLGEGFRYWNDPAVDSPWCFLAWCFEWTAFLDQGYGYLSSLPVAMDGSCNGIQHYSAALLDEVGGRAVNRPALRDRPALRHLPDRRGQGHRLPQ